MKRRFDQSENEMADKIREYGSETIQVRYDVKRCIHAAECVKRLPGVFDPNRRPWIDPDGGSPDAIAETVMQCPTGALQFERLDGGAAERPAAENTVRLSPDGPLYANGDIEVVTATGTVVIRDTRVALCRCGASNTKPLCDGQHADIDFKDAGVSQRVPDPQDAAQDDKLTITVAANGPLLLQGPYRVIDANGSENPPRIKGALCRCGQTQSRPYCDGTHKTITFDD